MFIMGIEGGLRVGWYAFSGSRGMGVFIIGLEGWVRVGMACIVGLEGWGVKSYYNSSRPTL